ncbi:hypothetical protein A9Q87_06630 [Flavobacteriales bacterium 34_180_T64]|nr:hypothetical protein A9Q87_06630 [Flavobacteriales bacterium 34_180_T64]
MHKRRFTILGIVVMCLISCQFSENIYVNEDGTGKMEFSMDASELMKMAAGMDEGKLSPGMDKKMDSTIVFKEFLNEKSDSIATLSKEDQKKLKVLENFEMHMVSDPATNKMVFDISSKFESVKKIKELFNAMNSMGNLQGQGGLSSNDSSNPFALMRSGGNTDVNFSFKNNVFKRSSKVIDTLVQKQAMDSMTDMAMMFEASNYKLNYHFKKRIKSVSNENAIISEDGMSVVLDVSFMESLRAPELLNIEVVLED